MTFSKSTYEAGPPLPEVPQGPPLPESLRQTTATVTAKHRPTSNTIHMPSTSHTATDGGGGKSDAKPHKSLFVQGAV